jgi:hypothetical protein
MGLEHYYLFSLFNLGRSFKKGEHSTLVNFILRRFSMFQVSFALCYYFENIKRNESHLCALKIGRGRGRGFHRCS